MLPVWRSLNPLLRRAGSIAPPPAALRERGGARSAAATHLQASDCGGSTGGWLIEIKKCFWVPSATTSIWSSRAPAITHPVMLVLNNFSNDKILNTVRQRNQQHTRTQQMN